MLSALRDLNFAGESGMRAGAVLAALAALAAQASWFGDTEGRSIESVFTEYCQDCVSFNSTSGARVVSRLFFLLRAPL